MLLKKINTEVNHCLNRNILECKCGYGSLCRQNERVLIETYWNVNKVGEYGENPVTAS